ncbi:MAG: hypothetical protein HC904_06380 [Blastochloris sp.]|nr:hypothetical protein [Blastochloris sp.]
MPSFNPQSPPRRLSLRLFRLGSLLTLFSILPLFILSAPLSSASEKAPKQTPTAAKEQSAHNLNPDQIQSLLQQNLTLADPSQTPAEGGDKPMSLGEAEAELELMAPRPPTSTYLPQPENGIFNPDPGSYSGPDDIPDLNPPILQDLPEFGLEPLPAGLETLRDGVVITPRKLAKFKNRDSFLEEGLPAHTERAPSRWNIPFQVHDRYENRETAETPFQDNLPWLWHPLPSKRPQRRRAGSG